VVLKPCPISFNKADGYHLPKSFSGPDPGAQTWCIVDLGNWKLEGLKSEIDIIQGGDFGSDFTQMDCSIQLTRVPTYYLWNIVVVMFVLVLSAFSVVGVPYEDYADRMSITMTLLLTVVAFKFVIATYVRELGGFGDS
jgi:hypothetical protein